VKRKPDQVHVFRLELQQKERELLDTYTTAYAVKSWSEPVVNILRDVTATLTVIGILVLLLGDRLNKVLPEGWDELTTGMTKEGLMDWLEPQNIAGAGIGGFLGIILGGLAGSVFGPIGIVAGAGSGGIAGAAAGSYTVEELEDLAKEREQIARTSKIAGGILLYHALQRAKETLSDPAGGLYAAITGR
tara:strand:+ start:2202 stop:2768 length:567 start_codon:yes stop_codon:yes gene_type:complete